MPFTVSSHTSDFTEDIARSLKRNGHCECFKGPSHLTQINQVTSSEPIWWSCPFQITFHDPNNQNGRVYWRFEYMPVSEIQLTKN